MAISGFQQLKQDLKHIPPKAAVVAAAHEEHTLQAVRKAQEDGLIRLRKMWWTRRMRMRQDAPAGR